MTQVSSIVGIALSTLALVNPYDDHTLLPLHTLTLTQVGSIVGIALSTSALIIPYGVDTLFMGCSTPVRVARALVNVIAARDAFPACLAVARAAHVVT